MNAFTHAENGASNHILNKCEFQHVEDYVTEDCITWKWWQLVKSDFKNLNSEFMNFQELIEKVKHIPYGRNANRYDFSLVLTENKGTCSSKHAFLKDFAVKNQIENVQLFIGIFKMNEQNTPKIAPLLSENSIDYIPEAHCYLKINNEVIDITTENSFFEKIENDILKEIEIQPNQVVDFKIEYHQNFLKNWITASTQTKSFTEIWDIREKCIAKLSE